MESITRYKTVIELPKKIVIKEDENLNDILDRLFFVNGKSKHRLVVLHRNHIICPLCKSKSNRNGHRVYGKQTYMCENKQCRHQFVPNETLPGVLEHPLPEIIKGMECIYEEGMSLRKASDYLKTKGINISHNGIRGWKRIVPDLLRAVINSIESDRDAISTKSIKKAMSWLKPWRRYEYAKVSTYTPVSSSKEKKIKDKPIEFHKKDNKRKIDINKHLSIEIDENDELTQRIVMALLNNANLTSTDDIADAFDVTEPTIITNTKKYLDGGSSNLIDKRGGSKSKLTPIVMEKIIHHMLDSVLNSEKITNTIIADRVNAELNGENKISHEIVRQFRNAINFDKTMEKLNLINRTSTGVLKKTKMKE